MLTCFSQKFADSTKPSLITICSGLDELLKVMTLQVMM